MKYTVGLIAAVAAIGASAQSFADLPECGQTCVQNVLDQSSDLGCEAEDAGCLCKNEDFTYGIRDCSLESCEDDAESIINYGAEYCRSKGGVVITTASSDPAATTGPGGSANTVPSETSSGAPGGTPGPATSGAPTDADTTSGSASGSPPGPGLDDSDAGADEEGGIARNAAAPAGLLVVAGIAAILI